MNRVVYDSVHFVPVSRCRVPGGGLLFESRFESGNLRRVNRLQRPGLPSFDGASVVNSRAIHVQRTVSEDGSAVDEYALASPGCSLTVGSKRGMIANRYDLLLNWDHGTRGHTQWRASHAVRQSA